MSYIDHLRLKNATVKEIVVEVDAPIHRMKLPLLLFYAEKKIRVVRTLKFRVREWSLLYETLTDFFSGDLKVLGFWSKSRNSCSSL